MPNPWISILPWWDVPRVHHFEFCHNLLYLLNYLKFLHQIWYGSSLAWPEGTWEIWSQRHLLFQRYKVFCKNAYNFCKYSSKFDLFMSLCSLASTDSNDMSFSIFQQCDCPPYWSKSKTVFSLLLLQILLNIVQNLIRCYLDRAAQKWLNRFLIFTTNPEIFICKVDLACVCCLMLVSLA